MRWQEEARERFRSFKRARAEAGGQVTNSSGAGAKTETTSNASAVPVAMSGWMPAQAMLTCFYSLHGGFLTEGELMLPENIDKIRHIPTVAVQGAADLICPPGTALDLHEAWPEMRLVLVQGAGHSMYDPKITHELVKAADEFFDITHGAVTF